LSRDYGVRDQVSLVLRTQKEASDVAHEYPLGLDGTPELAAKIRALKNVACPHGVGNAVYCWDCQASYEEQKAWKDGVEDRIRDLESSLADYREQVDGQVRGLAAEMRRSFEDMARDFNKLRSGQRQQIVVR
jgi:hypothetical protein